jgi:CHAD domain-containing protein
MALAADRVQKALRKLRKCVSKLPADPAPEEVHELRTQARHIENIATVLSSPDAKEVRSLLKSIRPMRKAAGRVRDLDVLVGNALSLNLASHSDSLIHLVESLGMMRQENAAKLLDTVHRRPKAAQRNLKRYEELVGLSAANENSTLTLGIRRRPPEQRISAITAEILHDLSHGPAPHPQNLHSLRLKIKELRSILQLMPDSDRGLITALGEVKDAIGDWHDWQQLAEVATQSLDARNNRALLSRIRATLEHKLKNALAAASALRNRYLKPVAKMPRVVNPPLRR